MKKKEYKDIDYLAEDMYSLAYNQEKYVVAVLFYDDAAALVKELLCIDEVEAADIDLEMPECSYYEDEYYVALTDDLQLSVEPAYQDGKYLDPECDVMFIDEEADEHIYADLENTSCILITITYDSPFDVEHVGIDYCRDDEGDECENNEYEPFEGEKLVDDGEKKIHIVVSDETLISMSYYPEFYAKLLTFMKDAFMNAEYEFDDDKKLKKVHVDLRKLCEELDI